MGIKLIVILLIVSVAFDLAFAKRDNVQKNTRRKLGLGRIQRGEF